MIDKKKTSNKPKKLTRNAMKANWPSYKVS